jgi:hypothetical protein
MANPLSDLQALLRLLAQELKEAIDADPRAAGWNKAFLDVRYSEDGGRWARNSEATVGSKSVSCNFSSGTLNRLLGDIWQARLGEQFYGFVLSLTSLGEVEVKFNYDANCFSDPAFWA